MLVELVIIFFFPDSNVVVTRHIRDLQKSECEQIAERIIVNGAYTGAFCQPQQEKK